MDWNIIKIGGIFLLGWLSGYFYAKFLSIKTIRETVSSELHTKIDLDDEEEM